MTLNFIFGFIALVAVSMSILIARKRNTNFSGHLEDLENIFKVLSGIERETQIERTLIFMTKNTGTKPTPGVPIYVTCIYEGPNTQERAQYQNIQVDAEYVSMMLQAKRDNRIDYVVELMEPSLLQRIYTSQGVTFSSIFFIHEDSKAFYYGSFASHTMKYPDAATDVKIDLAISQLQYIWKRPKNKIFNFKIKL